MHAPFYPPNDVKTYLKNVFGLYTRRISTRPLSRSLGRISDTHHPCVGGLATKFAVFTSKTIFDMSSSNF